MSSRFDKLVSGHKPSVDVEVMNDEAPRDVKTRYLRHPGGSAPNDRHRGRGVRAFGEPLPS